MVSSSTVKFPKGFMKIAGFSNNGKLKCKGVSSKTGINSLYYQQNILEPVLEGEIRPLYGKDIYKVEHPKDKASRYMFKSSATYLAKEESETQE
ncbi:hypothetical protein TNCV_2212461 [Trichonephila clavipes]|nr:hypothetical protein TNCV_2212461 [Trichonephila clavipes]